MEQNLPATVERKVVRSWGRSCLRMLVVYVVGGGLGVAYVGSILWIIGGRDARRDPALFLPLAAVMLSPLVLMVAAYLFTRLRGRRFDRAFAPWGLEGRQLGAVTRGWRGTVAGRPLHAWVAKGPRLELYLGCDARTRGWLSRGGPLIVRLNRALAAKEPLDPPPLAPPLDAGVKVYADDPDWMRRLLARPRAREAVAGLLEEDRRTAALVSIGPDAVHSTHLFVRLADLEAPYVERRLGELGALASEIDALGPSPEEARPTRLEIWARTERGRWLNRFFAVIGCVLLLVYGGFMVVLWSILQPR